MGGEPLRGRSVPTLLGWEARKANPKGKATVEELGEVRAKISALMGL